MRAGILVRADGADHRQREVASIVLDPHRSGGEAHPIAVAAFAFESWEPNPLAGPLSAREVCQFQYASTAPAIPSA